MRAEPYHNTKMNIQNILVTGGAGFIGSEVIRQLVTLENTNVINLDKLTYAGNLENLKSVESNSNYTFVKGDICDESLLKELFKTHKISKVIHLAAESHVDRSINDPLLFVRTNLIGTATLLNVAKSSWEGDYINKVFYHISTDEVYGSLNFGNDLFKETTSYDPRSPYSASKAGSDHLVRSFFHTYGFPILISNCSNNYGPYQFPEKLVPLCINNILNKKPLPIYGKGENIRDWLYVSDHADAILTILKNGQIGETYNIGGNNEWSNLDLVKVICKTMDLKLNRPEGDSEKLITFVQDRAGHDLRYAIDSSKIQKELGWTPSLQFEDGLKLTVDWYLQETEWLRNVSSGEYKSYYKNQYG